MKVKQEQLTNASDIFASPRTGKPLKIAEMPIRLFNEDEQYNSIRDVLIMLEKQNQDYEGAYLGKTKYIPRIDRFPCTIPLWLLTNGYVWEIRKHFSKGAIICELGCASGVNYFGNRYSMIGVDFSLQSLQGIENYKYKIQANALQLPFKNESLDGIISAYFWEHIDPKEKEVMLIEFRRVLKPGGKVIMLYDVETKNSLLNQLKKDDLNRYEELFLKSDFHIGYETLDENLKKFDKALFKVIKHFGMERTILQSTSVYIKLSDIHTYYGKYARVMKWLTSSRWTNYINIATLRIIDNTIGLWINKNKSRIAISVLQK